MVKIDFEEIEKDVLDILKRYIAIPAIQIPNQSV